MSVRETNFIKQENGWDQVKLDSITSKEQAEIVENHCLSTARLERLKSGGLMILSGTAALGDKVLMPLAMAIIAFQVAQLVVCIVFLPCALIYPAYELITSLTGLALGLGIFGAFMGYRNGTDIKLKDYSDEFFKSSQKHWDCSNHWYAQAAAVSERSVRA